MGSRFPEEGKQVRFNLLDWYGSGSLIGYKCNDDSHPEYSGSQKEIL